MAREARENKTDDDLKLRRWCSCAPQWPSTQNRSSLLRNAHQYDVTYVNKYVSIARLHSDKWARPLKRARPRGDELLCGIGDWVKWIPPSGQNIGVFSYVFSNESYTITYCVIHFFANVSLTPKFKYIRYYFFFEKVTQYTFFQKSITVYLFPKKYHSIPFSQKVWCSTLWWWMW